MFDVVKEGGGGALLKNMSYVASVILDQDSFSEVQLPSENKLVPDQLYWDTLYSSQTHHFKGSSWFLNFFANFENDISRKFENNENGTKNWWKIWKGISTAEFLGMILLISV